MYTSGVVVKWIKPLLKMPAFHIGELVQILAAPLLTDSLLVFLGRPQRAAHVLEPLSPTWAAQMEFLAPDAGLAQP